MNRVEILAFIACWGVAAFISLVRWLNKLQNRRWDYNGAERPLSRISWQAGKVQPEWATNGVHEGIKRLGE